MTDERHDREQTPREEPKQTWGQGEGEQEPTIPEEDAESSTTPSTYTEGTATELGEPESLAREDEGMDR
jgi:hypothetical protein